MSFFLRSIKKHNSGVPGGRGDRGVQILLLKHELEEKEHRTEILGPLRAVSIFLRS